MRKRFQLLLSLQVVKISTVQMSLPLIALDIRKGKLAEHS